MILKYITARLEEASTWAGLSGVLIASAALVDQLHVAGSTVLVSIGGFCGAIAALLRDPTSTATHAPAPNLEPLEHQTEGDEK